MNLSELPAGSVALAWALMGLMVGSFLNVCIYRLPREGMSVGRPRRSHCPACNTELGWIENVPLLSWIIQAGRCRTCSARISLRYPLVEISNAGLWYLAASLAGPNAWPLWCCWSVVLSGLLVASMVDFDCFQIPDEVSLGGCVLAPLACLWVPGLQGETLLALVLSDDPGGGVDRVGALLACLAGMGVGACVLLLIGALGKKLYGAEAMGLGDVKLLAAGGGFVGPGGALAALAVAALVASVFGLLNMLRFFILSRSRARGRGRSAGIRRSLRVARLAGRYLPFGPFLGLGIGIVLLAWDDLSILWI
ncbi:MAG TPA: prepilin peptidase [Planctomycetes bacterium]|nr:prepilin peptidase [Planctomycetota bacterium]HIK62303.1 prepilin peptidase [Planctomycetota bacterium]